MINSLLLNLNLILFVVASCGNSKRPELSDMETYVIQQEINQKGFRTTDPDNPPIVIDIASRKLNIKKINLSDYYTHVRYIKLKHPKPATEGLFLFDVRYTIRRDGGGSSSYRGYNSLFKFTDDYIIAGDDFYGLHCYNKEGAFLFTIETNGFPKTYNAAENTVTVNRNDVKGYIGPLSIINNHCLYRILDDNQKIALCLYDLSRKERLFTKSFVENAYFLNANSFASYVYSPLDTSSDFLFTFDIKGDTLFRFQSFNPVPERKGNLFLTPPSGDIYYHKDQLTIRQSLNDTVYRVVSPNRLLPVYVLNFGAYKTDIRTILTEEQPDKFRPTIWKETDEFILFVYTQNRDIPNNRRDGLVKFFYSYFDKKSKRLYHLNEGTAVPENEFLIENPIPNALPFLFSQVNIDNNRFSVCYSKKRLEEIIKHKGFSSLPTEQQNRLKTLQKELDANEVLIMILE